MRGIEQVSHAESQPQSLALIATPNGHPRLCNAGRAAIRQRVDTSNADVELEPVQELQRRPERPPELGVVRQRWVVDSGRVPAAWLEYEIFSRACLARR